MIGWIRKLFGGSQISARSRARHLRAAAGSYDSAKTTDENRKHWAETDSLSADATLDPGTRQILRDRCRYEARNNGYFGGLIESLANDLVGTGPRLQVTIPGIDRDTTRLIEAAWLNWTRAANLAEDLRLLHSTRIRDGECFALLVDNPLLPQTGRTTVSLDLALYEAEQVADPFHVGTDPLYVDGIRRDRAGNPVEYTFLEGHPGSISPMFSFATRKYPAAEVIHWWRPERPGQTRGVPLLQSSLPLFGQLRRYTLATLGAAELAAMLAGVMKTDQPAVDGSPVEIQTMDTIELVRNALVTLPGGWDATQFKPEQPVGTYADFKQQILTEIGRPAQCPRNVITGDSSPYNYSSAKLDERLYFRAVRVERARLRFQVIDRIFGAWVEEAALAQAIPPALPPLTQWSWEWHWDGFESIDPQRDAQTDETMLRAGTTTLAEVYARRGQDWEEAVRQRARERDLLAELGLSQAQASPQAQGAQQQQEGAYAAQ